MYMTIDESCFLRKRKGNTSEFLIYDLIMLDKKRHGEIHESPSYFNLINT